MFCKEDLAWFKNLESYKRIELMCTLLNMCLPFELRFLGTCLEELGRKDAQDLRGFEQRVNNPQEFNNEFAQFQSGEPTDMKVRRMMAMYLALVRACNRTCVHALYKTLEGWGDRDFTKISDGDPLQELLLVYTMAINHPVFSFEQRMKCGEIYSKILVCKNQTVTSQTPSSSQSIITASSTSVSPLSSSTIQSQVAVVNQQHPQPASITSSPPPLANQPQSQALLQPTTIALHPQPMASQILIPSISMFPQMRPTEPTSLQIGVENISQIPVPSNMVIQPDFSLPPPWTMRPSFNHIYPPVLEGPFPPSSTSPHLSQPSSPSHSRTGSPTRNQPPSQQPQQQPSQSQVTQQSQSQQNQSGSHRSSQTRAVRANRRASSETTPPPLQSQTNISYIGDDMIVANIKKYEDLNMDGAWTQLQQLRNGYTRPTSTHHTIPRQTKSYLHQHHMLQHQQATQQQMPAFNPNAATTQMAYALGNMSLVENVVHQKSAGSDSGSSVGSVGDSPPDTPSLVMGNISSTTTTTTTNPAQMRAKQQLSLSNRLNKIQQGGSALYSSPPAQNSPQQNTGNSTTNTNSNNNNNNNNNTDFSGQVTSSNNNSLNNSNNNSLVMAATTTDGVNPLMLQHQPYHPPTTTQRPQPVLPVMAPFHPATATTAIFQVPPNGEIIFPFQTAQPVQTLFLPPPAQTTTAHSHRSSPSTQQMPPPPTQTPPMLLNTSAFPTTKKVISCFNCGSTSHTGRECHETSMEDVTRNATYKLDYSSNSNLHSLNTAPATSSFAGSKQSASSVSLSSMVSDSGMIQQQNSNSGSRDHMTNSASAPQFEPIPSTSPIIIDLTQDTSSSSSSSVSSILK